MHSKTFLTAILLLIVSLNAKAGWIITGRYIDQDGKTILQRYFIQDYQVKFEQYNIIYTVNLKTNELILVDPENLVYYKGTIDSYIQGLKQMKMKHLQELLADVPANESAAVREKYNEVIETTGQSIVPVKDSISVIKVLDSLKVFGKSTEKYIVSVGGRKAEETWISPWLDVSGQFSWDKYLYVISVLEPENTSLNYMVTEPYSSLLRKGFPVRRIMTAGGYRVEMQANKYEEKQIPAYEFYTPAKCKELTFDQWINRNSIKQVKYDDYE